MSATFKLTLPRLAAVMALSLALLSAPAVAGERDHNRVARGDRTVQAEHGDRNTHRLVRRIVRDLFGLPNHHRPNRNHYRRHQPRPLPKMHRGHRRHIGYRGRPHGRDWGRTRGRDCRRVTRIVIDGYGYRHRVQKLVCHDRRGRRYTIARR